ncbi:LOW QUALITY PROTEIN: hypothetical protein PHAVU_009G074000 [Phaseolus vulgaris]
MDQPITHSPGRVPFSWEIKPGIPKVTVAESFQREHKFVHKLQLPPPSTSFQRNYDHAFQCPIRMQDHDPFLEAYEKCTRSRKSVKKNKRLKLCKHSRVVRDYHFVMENNFLTPLLYPISH